MFEPVYLAALSSNDHIGPVRFQKIAASYAGLSGFFSLSTAEQMEFLGVRNPRAADAFQRMIPEGETIVSACAKKNIKMLSADGPDYPVKLKAIPDAPFLLYQLGEPNHSAPLIGVVGTRDPSPDSAAVNEFFTRELAECGIGIVSGLARGHDSIAQRTALECDGYTAAVLGCGVDLPYPKESANLYEAVRRHGTVFSEYPPGRHPLTWYFPLRNRIISGLSDAVLLVQAPEKSGALITADYAEKQGKDVYVVPGNPTDPRYAGSNRLIRYGCKLALKPEDIILDLLGKKPARKPVAAKAAPDGLNPDENKILQSLDAETYIDDLAVKTGMPLSSLNLLLTRMELKGLLTQYPGRFYARAPS